MALKVLYGQLQNDDLGNEMKGELILQKNRIVWRYDLSKNSEVFDSGEKSSLDDDDDDNDEFNYDDVISTEERLQEAYDSDIELIQNFIYEIGDSIDWLYSDPEIKNTVISFYIYA